MEDRTEKQLLQAVAENPGNSDSHQELGRYYNREGNLAEAEKCLVRALEIDATDYWNYLYMGNIQHHKKDYDTAIAFFEIATTIMPNDPCAYWCMAGIYQKRKQVELANKFFNKAVNVAPSDETAREKLRVWNDWYLSDC